MTAESSDCVPECRPAEPRLDPLPRAQIRSRTSTQEHAMSGQGLADVKIVDGEPVAASLIPRAVTAGELLFDDGATQTFEIDGDTSYVEADGRPTEGKWYVDEDGRFCSSWSLTYR